MVLAGGPVELAVTIELLEGGPAGLVVSGDRARGRSEDFAFTGALGEPPLRLDAPLAGVPSVGGVMTSLAIAPSEPVELWAVVNQYLSLERARGVLGEGQRAELTLECRRRVVLSPGNPAPPRLDGAVWASVTLGLTVERHDAVLASLLRRIAEDLLGASPPTPVERERALTALTAIRDPIAGEALRSLAEHPDPAVAARAGHALARLDGQGGA